MVPVDHLSGDRVRSSEDSVGLGHLTADQVLADAGARPWLGIGRQRHCQHLEPERSAQCLQDVDVSGGLGSEGEVLSDDDEPRR